jgi:transposase-like protein
MSLYKLKRKEKIDRIKEVRHYSKEFKEEVVKLSYERKLCQEAKELGVDSRRICQ